LLATPSRMRLFVCPVPWYRDCAMKLIINGEEKTFDSVTNVAELIARLALKGDRIAVELNHGIVPRTNWDGAALHDGDRLEIVHFVGGGLGWRFATQETEALNE